MRAAALIIPALLLAPSSASALRPALWPVIIGNAASSPTPDYGIDFRLGSATGWTNTRASAGMAANNAGTWTDFATTTVRVTNRGALVEQSRINIVKHDNDQTNVLWVKSNMTAAKDQTGIDGVANGASSLLATAANATSLQTITTASAARMTSAFVKRLVGAGLVDMTTDGGTTWTPVIPCDATTALGKPECRVSIPVQTVTNPTVGLRLQTSGDKIAVAAAQSEIGAPPSSPIFTTTANVTRNTDVISLTTPPTFTDRVTIAASIVQDVSLLEAALTGVALTISDGSNANRVIILPFNVNNGVPVSSYALASVTTAVASNNRTPPRGSIRSTMIVSVTPGFISYSVDGGPVSTAVSASTTPTGLTTVTLGGLFNGASSVFGYVEAAYLWKDVALNGPQLRSWWNGR